MPSPLPESLRAVVWEKLYAALAEFMSPSVHHAAAINTIGCYLLCHLTKHEYDIVAGSITVRQGGTPLELHANPDRIDEHEYYLWIECRHADGRAELIDFAAPWWKDWSRESGALWLGPAPETVWCFLNALNSRIAQYTPEWEITNMVRVALHNAFRSPQPPEEVAFWESVINKALDLLAQDAAALDYMVQNGVAEPAGPSIN